MHRSKYDTIESAQIVTYLRALGARERGDLDRNPDYLAKRFLNLKWRLLLRFPLSLTKWYVELVHPGIYSYISARTKHFDALLLAAVRAGVEQLVILGSGYDTRPYRFCRQLDHVRVFELDFPGTLGLKKERLCQQFGRLPDHVAYVPIDFNTQSIEEALHKAHYDECANTFFHWEGVSYYLSRPVIESVLAFVSEHSGPGSSIAFDYAVRAFVTGNHSGYGARQLARWTRQAGEPYRFGMDCEEMASFLDEKGFAISSDSDFGPSELADAYLKNSERPFPARVNAIFRIVHAQRKGIATHPTNAESRPCS